MSAKDRVCQAWLDKDWSTSGKLLDIDSVEDSLGDRLRLAGCKDRFGSDDAARASAQQMAGD